MADFNKPCTGSSFGPCGSKPGELVCIDTYRVLDSCRDKDCYESVRVYLTNYGQEIIERTSNIRVKSATVANAHIDTETVPFNRGFYQLIIRIHTVLHCEACVCPGNPQEFEGVAVVEKRVILYGGEGGVNIFKSDSECSQFCPGASVTGRVSGSPVATLEIADPLVLGITVAEPGCRCLCCCAGTDEIPERVSRLVSGSLIDDPRANKLLVTLGFFSVVRISRPAQLLVNATDYSVPDKECVVGEEEDPCQLFRTMAFPVAEFSPSCVSSARNKLTDGDKKCCRD